MAKREIEDLFADSHGLAAFHDCLFEAIGRDFTDDELREVFDSLPDDIQETAQEWGLVDTVFRDDAYEYLQGIQIKD